MVIAHLSGRFLSRPSPQQSYQFHSTVFHGIRDKLYDFIGYLYIMKQSMIQLCGTILYTILLSIHAIATFFRVVLLFATPGLSMSLCFSRTLHISSCLRDSSCLFRSPGRFMSLRISRTLHISSCLQDYSYLRVFRTLHVPSCLRDLF